MARGLSKAEVLAAAAENRTEPILRFLKEGGGLDDARNEERQSVLHVSAMKGTEDCLRLLLQSPKVLRDINSRDRAKRTALHLASAMGYDVCAQALLEAGATLDLQDEKGNTPLHLAVKFEWPETARTLLDAGADPLISDAHGSNAVDMATHKGDEDAASLIASFARRRQPSMVGQLKRCLLPGFSSLGGGHSPKANAAPPSVRNVPGSLPPPAMMGAPQRPPPPEPQRRAQEAPSQNAKQEQPPHTEIEWHGLEPVVVEREVPAAPQREQPAGAQQPAPSPLSAALEADAAARRGQQEQQQQQQDQPTRGRAAAQTTDDLNTQGPQQGARSRPCSAPPARRGQAEVGEDEQESPAAADAQEFALFRLHGFFEDGVKRLEFEVEWNDSQPSVGAVKPKGEAARRGIAPGDRLVEIAGARTTGKGREELLPLLKTRPLLLKIDREERVRQVPQQGEPHLELDLHLRGQEEGEDVGLEVAVLGRLPVAASVRPGLMAWRSGVLEGDGLSKLDGRDVTQESKSALQVAVNARPRVLTVWRRPQGVALSSPWQA